MLELEREIIMNTGTKLEPRSEWSESTMGTLLRSAKSFSSVFENVDEQFFSQCAREYAGSLVSMVVEQYGTDGVPDPGQFLSMLRHPLASGHQPLWCPELGLCLNSLRIKKLPQAQRGLTQILVNLLTAGVPGSWTIDLSEPMLFRWADYLLPRASHLEISSDGKQATVHTRDADSQQTLEFHATVNGHLEWHSDEGESIPSIQLGENHALLLSGPQSKEMGLPNTVLPGVMTVTETHKQHFAETMDLVREEFPAWCSWFDRVLRTITISESPPEGVHSGTTEGFYGSIWISDCHDKLKVAESLIHESSHQYYFLLSRLVDLTNDDGRLFYSPFVGIDRPPDKLLLAYHAFTNVEMFYRECVRKDLRAAHCELTLAQLKREMGQVQQALANEIDLTPVGQCMFDTLYGYRSSYAGVN